MLEACRDLGGGLENVVVFNSLSKRSSCPGLRIGFVIGEGRFIDRFARLRDYGGAAPPLPLLAAARVLLGDEEHVAASLGAVPAEVRPRRGNSWRAPRILPPAGRLLPVARRGRRRSGGAPVVGPRAAVRVLPGAYVARPGADGRDPGAAYIRVALVHDLDTTREALGRLARVL